MGLAQWGAGTLVRHRAGNPLKPAHAADRPDWSLTPLGRLAPLGRGGNVSLCGRQHERLQLMRMSLG